MTSPVNLESRRPENSRFYGELARWWPLISPVEEYADEAREFARVLRSAAASAQTLLELGSGGGHNAYYLKKHFRLTLSDLSEHMLAVSAQLNPECEHIPGDMRSLDLGRVFDVVFIHDAIHYMTTEGDLAAAFSTAYRHCRPGGVVLIVPDELAETFEPDSDCGGSDGPDGSGVRFLEWNFSVGPDATVGTTFYSFVTREADGTLESFSEAHLFGLFTRATWLRLIEEQGFRVELHTEQTNEDRTPRTLFLCRRPES
jgi:SAM-dependent methyltransferase